MAISCPLLTHLVAFQHGLLQSSFGVLSFSRIQALAQIAPSTGNNFHKVILPVRAKQLCTLQGRAPTLAQHKSADSTSSAVKPQRTAATWAVKAQVGLAACFSGIKFQLSNQV